MSLQSISMNEMGNSGLINSVSNSKFDNTEESITQKEELGDQQDPFEETKRALTSSLEGDEFEKVANLGEDKSADNLEESESANIIEGILEKSVEEDPTD